MSEKLKVTKFSKIRRSKNFRLILIVILLAIVAALYFLWGKFRAVLIGLFIVLLTALGLEVSSNDWDLGKLLQTGSFSESKVEKNSQGNWMIGDRCDANNFNCDDFEYQEDAQYIFEECDGHGDINRLDGDNDGMVCEHLPKKN